MSEQPATPAKEPGQDATNNMPPVNPKTHCPRCRAPEVLHAHPHCAHLAKPCPWLTCKCGTIWDPKTGNYNLPTKG